MRKYRRELGSKRGQGIKTPRAPQNEGIRQHKVNTSLLGRAIRGLQMMFV